MTLPRRPPYAATHHTLAVAYSVVHDGFPLGRWLSRQRHRARHAAAPTARHRALTAIDPWWNPPWPLAWQRSYTGARIAHDNGGRPPVGIRLWSAAQQTAWPRLRPEQHQLLTHIGITPRTETTTGPRKTSRVYPLGPGMAHARAYAATRGHLACSKNTLHNGFPLGQWLIQKRRATRQGRLSPTTTHTLNTLDPWWNPPWN
ncbi:helicase associated domain-containing protein [Streptomyces sp. NPDC056683]|uniref:helicase associated domain-containing protein n=1 Tax=Streptomyces sp. NPDC056683 TaxID=3345910 RepID=UPI0036AD2A74